MHAVGVLQPSLRAPGLLLQRPCVNRPCNTKIPASAQLGSAGPSGSGAAARSGGSAAGLQASAFGSCLPASSTASSSEETWLCAATGGDGGGSIGGGAGSGGSGGSGGVGGEGEEEDGEEYLDLQQAKEMAAAKGVSLPEDLAAAAAAGGLRRSVLEGYAKIMAGGWLTSRLAQALPAFRNRLIADKMFFFKVWAEVAIDSGCATVAELRKRGDSFWDEFEFYLSDLMVGLVLDVVLVTLIAPVAVLGRPGGAGAATSGLKKLLGRLPSAVFEKSSPGRKFTVAHRAGTFVKLGLEYSLAGITCGFIGQGVANSLMMLKRHYKGASEHDVAVPPLVRTALVWGMFMGLSSNSRYQIVFGLERIMDETIARRIPAAAYFTTLAIRFANNVVGGENFIDMARWAGVQ